MKHSLIENIFNVDRVYEYIDDPSEGPVYIIDNNNREFIFTDADIKSVLNYYYPNLYPKGYFWIREMILDFDAGMLKIEAYVDDKAKSFEITFDKMK